MADVGRLRWVLTADTAQFDRAMQRTAGGLRRLGRLAAAGLGVRGVGAMLRGAVNTADSIGKMAKAAGVGAEAIQAFRHTAELAGLTTEGFDEALLRFVNRLGQLQMNTGPLFTFLQRYDKGLLVALRRTDDTVTALGMLSEAVRGAPSSAIAQALSFQATGNRRMVNMLRGGRGGLAAGVQSAFANTQILSQSQISRMEQLQDAQLRASEMLNTKVLEWLVKLGERIYTTLDNTDKFFERASSMGIWELLANAGRSLAGVPASIFGRTSE